MIQDKSKKLQDREDFIKKYRAAINSNISKEQLANYLKIKPKSLIRRRLVIKETIGLDLPFLSSDESEITEDKLKKFRTELGKLTKEDNKIKLLPLESNDFTNYDRLIVTSAQNSTPINENVWASLLTYQKHNKNTGIKVIGYRYKNPTSIFSDKEYDYWDPKIESYLISGRMKIFNNLQIMADTKIQATSKNPVQGLARSSGTDSAIVGHPRIQWLTIPTPSKSLPKIMTSTGSVTLKNYTDSKIGKCAEEDHDFGAVIIEFDRINNVFHIRHIRANEYTGEFYDIAGGILKKYSPTSVSSGERLPGFVSGDSHVIFHDPTVLDANYNGKNSIMNRLNPENHFVHDLTDCFSISHHHNLSRTIKVAKHRFGRNNLERELQMSADFLDMVTREGMQTYVVKSNHDEHFAKWLETADPDEDQENSQFFHWMRYNIEKHLKANNTGFDKVDPFEFWASHPDQQRGLKNKHLVKFLKRNDNSLTIKNVNCTFHGDVGANGAKASAISFANAGLIAILGHSHTPSILHKIFTVGLNAYMDLEYKSGLDSWLHTNALIYPDGNVTLLNIIKGYWYLEQ